MISVMIISDAHTSPFGLGGLYVVLSMSVVGLRLYFSIFAGWVSRVMCTDIWTHPNMYNGLDSQGAHYSNYSNVIVRLLDFFAEIGYNYSNPFISI